MNFINTVIVKFWYIWIVVVSVASFSIFSAINIKKVKTDRIEECMNIYEEYDELLQNLRTERKDEKEKEKVLNEYLTKLQKSYETFKDLEYSDYLLLRQAQVLEELKKKEEAYKIYERLQKSPYNTFANEIASMIIARTEQNKNLWEKEILKSIFRANDPELSIVTPKTTLKIKLRYSLSPDNVGFLINSIRSGKINKLKVTKIDDKFIDLTAEDEIIDKNSYIQREKFEEKEVEGKRNFVMFKVTWDDKGTKPISTEYNTIRICKKCEYFDVKNYSLLGEYEGEINELEKLQLNDETLTLILNNAQVSIPQPLILKKD
jgi:hypothetical protein